MGSVFSYQEPANLTSDSDSEYETDEGETFFYSKIEESDCNLPKIMSTGNKKEQNLRTDAVETNTKLFKDIKVLSPSTITPDHVEQIEGNLDFYEKVSLVFLLYENADIALQGILAEESFEKNRLTSSTKLISTWARSKHEVRWQDQFLEALCIIQNYAIIEKLGFDKRDLNIQYLPFSPHTSLTINHTRKALYYVCEMFTKARTREFLKHLQADFHKKCISYQNFNENYLEIYFLYCFSMHYIKNNNLKNLIAIFKTMELEHICDILTSIMNVVNDTRENRNEINQSSSSQMSYDEGPEKPQFILNDSKRTHELQKPERSDKSVIGDNSILLPTQSLGKGDLCYEINPKSPGICLIINQRNFYQETDPYHRIELFSLSEPLKDRIGTDVDRDKLENTFKYCGFRVYTCENLTHEKMKSEIGKTLLEFTAQDSCLILCILSHGTEGYVFGVNSIKVAISDIENILYDKKYSNLLGKPKVLIVQSCQGSPLQEVVRYEECNTIDGPDTPKKSKNNVTNINEKNNYIVTDGPVEVPEASDLLTCLSTVRGYASIRNEKDGTWYIQELCKVLLEEGYCTSFTDILTKVNRNISSKKWVIKDEKTKKERSVCMVSQQSHTLRYSLFLPFPKPDSSSLS